MAGFRPTGDNGGSTDCYFQQGDILLESQFLTLNAVDANVTIPANQLISGYYSRSGQTAARTDTPDDPANLIAALAGNVYSTQPNIQGASFRFRYLNRGSSTSTFSVTSTPYISGTSYNGGIAAGNWKDFLFTILNTTPLQNILVNLVTGSPTCQVVNPSGQPNMPQEIGNIQQADSNITVGASIMGGGVTFTGNPQITGLITNGQQLLGFTAASNSLVTGTYSIRVGPAIRVDYMGGGTI